MCIKSVIMLSYNADRKNENAHTYTIAHTLQQCWLTIFGLERLKIIIFLCNCYNRAS